MKAENITFYSLVVCDNFDINIGHHTSMLARVIYNNCTYIMRMNT